MNEARKKSTVTLIVWILLLVVIGFLSISAWHKHQIRGHVVEALKAADTAKLVVMESATIHGGLARLEASDLSYNPKATASTYVAQITIDADGRIHLVTKGTGASPDPTLLLTPSEHAGQGTAPIQWRCEVVTGDPGLMPDDCRTHAPAMAASSAPVNAATAAGAASSHSP